MTTQTSLLLAVSDRSSAIAFYQAAFGAELLWKLGDEVDVVAGLSIRGANFFLPYEAPEYGTRSFCGWLYDCQN